MQGTKRITGLPVRLRNSLRTSDESERRSSIRSSRETDSIRRSRRNSEILDVSVSRRSINNVTDYWRNSGENLRSPRVALRDVSRLLQNSQSVNIRTLLESNEEEVAPTQQEEQPLESSGDNGIFRSIQESVAPETSDASTNNTNESTSDEDLAQPKNKKAKAPSRTETDDPLEGPSWMLNNVEDSIPPMEDEVTTTLNLTKSEENHRDYSRSNVSTIRGEHSTWGTGSEDLSSFVSMRRGGQRKPANNGNTFAVHGNDGDDDDDDDDGEQTTNLRKSWSSNPYHIEPNIVHNRENIDGATTNLERFVTKSRGSGWGDNTQDFTLMWRKPPAKNCSFGINDLILPVLESPIMKVTPAQSNISETEPTANLQRITQRFDSVTPARRPINCEDTLYNNTGLVFPALENLGSPRYSSVVEQENRSDEDENPPRRSKRPNKKRANYLQYGSDPDTPEKEKNVKPKRKRAARAKDPSSAKVVLEKLIETQTKKTSPTPESRQSQDFETPQKSSSILSLPEVGSDSDGSSDASSTNKYASSRPRRQKAPTNLTEPSVVKKLRRN